MDKSNSLTAINESLTSSSNYVPEDLGVPEIRHFLYKVKNAAQYTCPVYVEGYREDPEAQRRLQGVYLQLQNRLHSVHRPLKLVYRGESRENVLAWVCFLGFR